MNHVHPVAVIGAGQSGISVALSLKDRGVTPLLIDRSVDVGAAWRSRYDRLHLNTSRQFSHLPGRRYPPGTALYPSRDDVIAQFDHHAREDGIALRLATAVERIDHVAPGWRLRTSGGDVDAHVVVVATGWEAVPHRPDWPGSFSGPVIHSAEYRNPLPYRGLRVLVVGCGSSGMEIAHDLAVGGAERVWLSIRTPPNLAPRSGPAGLPVDVLTVPLYHLPPGVADRIARAGRLRSFGDLSDVGLPIPDDGPFTRAHRMGVAPTVIDTDVVDAIRNGSVEVVGDVAGLASNDVVLRDGSLLRPHVVICATGYRHGVNALVNHLNVFEDEKSLKPAGWVSKRGMHFHGFYTRPAFLGHVARSSGPLARRIIRQLRQL